MSDQSDSISDASPLASAAKPTDYRPLIVILLLIATLVAVFRIEGRLWWCKCGEPFLVSFDINSMHNSQHVIDPYSLSHVLHGMIFFYAIWLFARRITWPWKLAVAVLIETAWEILENSPIIIERYRAATISLGYEGDTIANSLSDVAMAMLGFGIAWKIGWKGSIAFFIASELFMLWWIRDNLALNVLMLIWPLDAVRQWQAS